MKGKFSMKKDECGTLFFLVLGIVYLILSLRHSPGTMMNPQEGFFPILIGVFIIIFSIWALLAALKNRSKRENLSEILRQFDSRDLISAILVFGCIAVYLMILNSVGFLLSSPPLVFALACIMGGKNLIVNAFISIVASALIYWIFWIIMRIPIPLGTIFLN